MKFSVGILVNLICCCSGFVCVTSQDIFISITDKQFPSSPLSLLDVRAAREQINMGGVTYPTLPLQDSVPRPQSGYGQPSVACSPAGSFARPLPPQPHSAYFSGMTGPQHPFYNRVRQKRRLCLEQSIS